MENTYKYLFPFEKVPPGAKIIIYGAGILGQEYLEQIQITHYCQVIGFLDKNFAEYKNSVVPVYAPDKIKELEFDFVIIALRGSFAVPAVKKILAEQDVADKKIVCVLERILPHKNSSIDLKESEDLLPELGFESADISFALFMSGGIGDMVTYKRLAEELHRLVPEATMDIFTVRGMEFLKWLYCEDKYVKNILPDLGVRYKENKEKYSFAISFIGSGLLSVDAVREEDFLPGHEGFWQKINLLQKRIKYEDLSIAMPAAIMFYRRMFRGENCYTCFNHGDVFFIRDKQIHIPSPPHYTEEFLQLGLKKYITLNIDNGTGTDESKVAKTWPTGYFEETARMFRQKYPDIGVVQIGAKDGKILNTVDRYFKGKEFGLVAEILKHSLFHLDIEGGLVHLASQAGTKCIVLFGPTLTSYNAYENNTNIKVGDCHGCYSLYQDAGICARNMKEPVCMYGITPEIVMEHIDEYLKSVGEESHN